MKQELINDIIQWDTRSWSRAIDYWEKNVDWRKINTCLELGGREGGLSMWLAMKNKSVICSDLIDVKVTAESLHQKYGVTKYITYEDIDATEIPYENHFDLIVFKSILGGIGRNDSLEIQTQVFEQMHKALKPGGKLLFAENLIASKLHQHLRKRFNKWGSYWKYFTIDEMKEFLIIFSESQLETTGVLGTFGRNEKQRNFLSAIDQHFLNKIFPKSWNYISYGIATK